MKAIVVAAAALAVASCAAPRPSDDLQVGISTVPSGARCDVSSAGVVIARDIEAPEIISVDRSSPEIEVTCVREGYVETTVLASVDREPAIIASIVPGDDVAADVDGADVDGAGVGGAPGTTSGNDYSFVYVELVRESPSFQGAFDGQPSTPFD